MIYKFLICIGIGILLSGCSEIQYYLQAIEGHLDILNRKQDIEALLEAPTTPPDLARKLKLIQDVRQFAIEQLHLPHIHGYTSYSNIERAYVTTIVTASHQLRLEPHKWCFLLVGCLSYRGYFSAQEAQAYAAELEKEGWDVALGKVRAYSTLKWLNNEFMPDYFKDPILNTFIERADTAIIQTLIHEMAHQVIFVAGDTSFNESFAVFVEQEGLRQYLVSRKEGAREIYQRHLQKTEDKNRFLQIIATFYQKFEQLYHSDLPDHEKRATKKQLFQEMQTLYRQRAHEFQVLNYNTWFAQPLNNAHLLGVRRYNNYVSSFLRIFQEQGQNWSAFFSKIKEIASLPQEKRTTYLKVRSASKNLSLLPSSR